MKKKWKREISQENRNERSDEKLFWRVRGLLIRLRLSCRTLAADEYPVLPMFEMDREQGLVMAPKIRLPASMDINAFLNSATGSFVNFEAKKVSILIKFQIYFHRSNSSIFLSRPFSGRGRLLLGISDDRLIKGLFLTPDQRKHVQENLKDLLTFRYAPPVSEKAFQVEFHPVSDGRSTDESNEDLPLVAALDSPADLQRKHIFRTGSLCWCDREALKKIKGGDPPKRFIIDIRVDAHQNDVPTSQGATKTTFVDEVGCVCVRRGPDNAIPTVEEILYEAIDEFERLHLWLAIRSSQVRRFKSCDLGHLD